MISLFRKNMNIHEHLILMEVTDKKPRPYQKDLVLNGFEMVINRELEKKLSRIIKDFEWKEMMNNNGRTPKSSIDLIHDFLMYSLSHSIEKMEDIPEKYDPIFKGVEE